MKTQRSVSGKENENESILVIFEQEDFGGHSIEEPLVDL